MLNVFHQKHNKWHGFRFDRVFGEDSNQDAVYAETQPLIRSVLDGEGWAVGQGQFEGGEAMLCWGVAG